MPNSLTDAAFAFGSKPAVREAIIEEIVSKNLLSKAHPLTLDNIFVPLVNGVARTKGMTVLAVADRADRTGLDFQWGTIGASSPNSETVSVEWRQLYDPPVPEEADPLVAGLVHHRARLLFSAVTSRFEEHIRSGGSMLRGRIGSPLTKEVTIPVEALRYIEKVDWLNGSLELADDQVFAVSVVDSQEDKFDQQDAAAAPGRPDALIRSTIAIIRELYKDGRPKGQGYNALLNEVIAERARRGYVGSLSIDTLKRAAKKVDAKSNRQAK